MNNVRLITALVTAIICVLSGCAGQRRFVDLGEDITKVSVQKNCVTEMQLRSTIGYGDPYNEVTLDVVFDGPNGDSLKIRKHGGFRTRNESAPGGLTAGRVR